MKLRAKLSTLGKRIGRAGPALARDTAGAAGIGSIAYGAWLITPAAGFITGGVLVVAMVILTARANTPAAGD